MLFRIPLASYWCLGWDCRESIFDRLKKMISVRKSSLSRSLSVRRRRARGHRLVLKVAISWYGNGVMRKHWRSACGWSWLHSVPLKCVFLYPMKRNFQNVQLVLINHESFHRSVSIRFIGSVCHWLALIAHLQVYICKYIICITFVFWPY